MAFSVDYVVYYSIWKIDFLTFLANNFRGFYEGKL